MQKIIINSKNSWKHVIIVRVLSSFGWENCIRITIGTKKENNFNQSIKIISE